MECIQDSMMSGDVMSLHGGEWRIHTSSVDDFELITESLEWLSGEESEIIIENEKSALGAPMKTIWVKMKSKYSKKSLQRLEKSSLIQLLEGGLSRRIDEHKFLHIRISLEKLVRGMATVDYDQGDAIVKGKFKLEVYPGQKAIDIAEELVAGLISD